MMNIWFMLKNKHQKLVGLIQYFTHLLWVEWFAQWGKCLVMWLNLSILIWIFWGLVHGLVLLLLQWLSFWQRLECLIELQNLEGLELLFRFLVLQTALRRVQLSLKMKDWFLVLVQKCFMLQGLWLLMGLRIQLLWVLFILWFCCFD